MKDGEGTRNTVPRSCNRKNFQVKPFTIAIGPDVAGISGRACDIFSRTVCSGHLFNSPQISLITQIQQPLRNLLYLRENLQEIGAGNQPVRRMDEPVTKIIQQTYSDTLICPLQNSCFFTLIIYISTYLDKEATPGPFGSYIFGVHSCRPTQYITGNPFKYITT